MWNIVHLVDTTIILILLPLQVLCIDYLHYEKGIICACFMVKTTQRKNLFMYNSVMSLNFNRA